MSDGSAEVTRDLRIPWDDDADDLYENAPCGYLSALPDGTIVKVNRTFLTWTGWSRGELVGRKRFRDLLTPGGRIYHETHYAPLLSMQNDVHEMAFDMLCEDGRRLPTLVNSVLSRDEAGAPRVIRTTIFNATERRGYEQELLEARRVAEDSETRVRMLQQIVAELAAAPTVAEVAEAVVRAPEVAFGATASSIWLVDHDRDQLVAVASTKTAGAGRDIPRTSAHPVAEVTRRGDLRVVRSVKEAEQDFPRFAEAMRAAGQQAGVLLPLTAVPVDAAASPDDGRESEVLGLLGFGFAAERTLSDTELRIVRLLGHQAGQALDRARLYDEARRAEARATFLAETSRALEEIPRLLPRARRLVDRIVAEIAQWAAVRLQIGPAGLLADAGGPEPDAERLAERVAEVMVSGEAWWGDNAEFVVLPLAAGGRMFGTLTVRMEQTRWTPAFLADLADRAGLALENARLYEQERAIARTLQRSLLAGDLPLDPRFTVETHYQAGAHDLEVGGDWFDAFLISSDKLAIVVGDVVGRGIDAATTMGQLRSAIRALASAEAGPARLLERLDRFVDRVESARMATVVYAEVLLAGGEMTYACAGHLPPLLHEPGGSPRYLMDGRSAPLGSHAGHTVRLEKQVRLAPGSRLLLYTDGLIERRGRGIDAGFDLLAREYAHRRDRPLPGLTQSIADSLVGRDNSDDVCLLVLALGTEQRLHRAIGADPMQIALLRRDLRGWLVSHDVDDDSAEAVLLACSEAVANAVEHGYRNDPSGVVEVVASVSRDEIEVRVGDRGEWRPMPADESRGRGLRLIRQVMDEVDIQHDDYGTVVTMRRDREGSAR